MIIFVFIVALIALIDISGSVLNEKITPLVYIVDVEEMHDSNELGDTSSMSSEELAKHVKDKIFDGGGSSDGEAKPK